MTNLPIQFLLHQLSTNEQDRERFNLLKLTTGLEAESEHQKTWANNEISTIPFCILYRGYVAFKTDINKKFTTDDIVINFIRTCLSRVNGEAVLGVFEGTTPDIMHRSDVLYLVFDVAIRHGFGIDSALTFFGAKMRERVPEYQEFINKI